MWERKGARRIAHIGMSVKYRQVSAAGRTEHNRDSRYHPPIRNTRITVAGGARAPMQRASLHCNFAGLNSARNVESVHREIASKQHRSGSIID